jgi:hypothetical protein
LVATLAPGAGFGQEASSRPLHSVAVGTIVTGRPRTDPDARSFLGSGLEAVTGYGCNILIDGKKRSTKPDAPVPADGNTLAGLIGQETHRMLNKLIAQINILTRTQARL